MNNIMVCVTKQKTCQRLIDYGKNMVKSEKDQLFVIHVSGSGYAFLDSSKDGDALEFLYEKAKEAGASLTVERSEDVMQTLLDMVDKNEITCVVTGEAGEKEASGSFIDKFRKRLSGKAELIVVPPVS